jgi:hypothetical protein
MMADPQSAADAAIQAVTQLRKALAGKKSVRQVQGNDERALVKATSLAWFNAHRRTIAPVYPTIDLSAVDGCFRQLTEYAERGTSRLQYLTLLQTLREHLIALRSQMLGTAPATDRDPSHFLPPDFSPLIPDNRMQEILGRRWRETRICMAGGADLAATVMMGGLLEGLFLARINTMADKSAAFKSKGSPKDSKSGNPLPLKEWGLKNYIDVAHELKWIRQSAKDVGEVLRDYRNYIHPQKEFSHGLSLDGNDTAMFWPVFSTLAEQIIASVKTP